MQLQPAAKGSADEKEILLDLHDIQAILVDDGGAEKFSITKHSSAFVPSMTFGDRDCNSSCAAVLSLVIPLDFEDLDIWTRGEWSTSSAVE